MIRIGQLLKTLIEWVKRLLWSYRGKVPKPFVALREKQYPLGLLKLVEGRDTLWAIRTWIICPQEQSASKERAKHRKNEPMDIHIYLDLIGSVEGRNRLPNVSTEFSRTATHTITVLKASHRLSYSGAYDYEHLFSGQYDFQGQMITAAEVQARIACDRLAILRGMRYIHDSAWENEVEEVYRQIMGLEGLPSTEAFKFWRLSQSRHSSKKVGRIHSSAGTNIQRRARR
ncbi:MAG: hypothetical protein AAGD25_02200 [Cyanobacteria bacterium P01_F01_bin.150]